MDSRRMLLVAVAALLLVAGVTAVQGRWTERWAKRQDDVLLDAARRLERAFPKAFGEWKLEGEGQTSRAELDRAGAVGSVTRVYRNQKTRLPVSAFVVCAAPHDASGHTPDRCYPGAGYAIAEPEHRETIPLQDGRVAEAYTGTFAKQTGQTLRVFWTYGVPAKQEQPEERSETAAEGPASGAEGRQQPLTWVAPQIARIALNDYPAVYKLYAIIDQTKLPNLTATKACSDFISEALPAFEAALAEGGSAAGTAVEPSSAPARTDEPKDDAASG